MRMILLYSSELKAEAILLAASPDRLRMIVRGSDDATELRLIKDQWMTEEGDAVDIESLIICGEGSGQPRAHSNAA